ncbi:hypothetical protein AB0K00_04310 [Dactylosporangium sp. NPDC049525]|uniref:hypothetical protein n=1 Tax=Dactylosporangium sp. NPDC049525 TaxID=3154730 RepID=UPI00343D9C4F
MPELSDLYGALADDANRAALSSPQALRRRADRRARTRVLLACAVTAVTVGIAGTAWGVLRGPSAEVVPAQPSPSSSSSSFSSPPPAASSAPAFKPPTSIPATAMLKLPAANRSDIADRDTAPTSGSGPCKAALPGRNQEVAQRNRETSFHHVGDPGRSSAETINQNITIYKAGQAEAFMSQLRAAVTACPSVPVTGGRQRYVLVPLQGLGDEAFRIESTRPLINPLDEVDGEVTSFSVYIRIGTVVTSVAFYGGEGHTTPRATDLQIVVDATIGPLRKWLIP